MNPEKAEFISLLLYGQLHNTDAQFLPLGVCMKEIELYCKMEVVFKSIVSKTPKSSDVKRNLKRKEDGECN